MILIPANILIGYNNNNNNNKTMETHLHSLKIHENMLGYGKTWWRHQMKTFSALLAICAGNSPVPGEFPAQRAVTLSFDVFSDLRLNKRSSKQAWYWRFETLPRPLWRHSNEFIGIQEEASDIFGRPIICLKTRESHHVKKFLFQ